MTAKHRKGKSNHKHEEDHDKSDIPESEVRTGRNSYTLVLFACLVVVIGGATGAWFCYQQHQTLTHLTDTVTGMQMKVVKLQASQETMRQTSDRVHVSDDVESRVNALEESYMLSQKQVDEALATAEHFKTSDLPAQVLSLHTEMKSRLAEIQRTTVSVEQLSQLQGKNEKFEEVGLQVEGLVTLSTDLSKQVQAITGRLEEAEAMLNDVATLRDKLKQQTAQLMGLEVQLKSFQTEMATIREWLPNERSKQLTQDDMEEQIGALRMKVRQQNSASSRLHAELRAQLDNLQWQVTQMIGGAETVPEPMNEAEGEPSPFEEEGRATEEEANLGAADSDSDEPAQEASDDEAYTEQTEEPLPSSETAETDATHTEREEPNLEEILSDEEEFFDELLLDEGDAKPGADAHDDNVESRGDAEQFESEEEEVGDEVEL
ncbi:protein KASH5 [Hippocampus zosterae]|uniref:protein KASH5 n=1 Tax=Hippocampus zosterae TaxID=109293 RepID=UPI00223D5726|nr:protein KASH5 [Hippocampus zosterae]